MKKEKLLSEKWVSVNILLVIAILYFIYSLGFMTNFYRLFYDGNQEMYDAFKELQLLNRFIFEHAIVTLLLSILGIVLGLHKKSVSLFHTIYLIGFLIYEISSMSTVLGAIPYYTNEYLNLDFSLLTDYVQTPFVFTLSYVFSCSIVLLLVVIIMKYFMVLFKHIKSNQGVKSND